MSTLTTVIIKFSVFANNLRIYQKISFVYAKIRAIAAKKNLKYNPVKSIFHHHCFVYPFRIFKSGHVEGNVFSISPILIYWNILILKSVCCLRSRLCLQCTSQLQTELSIKVYDRYFFFLDKKKEDFFLPYGVDVIHQQSPFSIFCLHTLDSM